MALITKAVRGTLDLLPSESYKSQYVESVFFDISKNFGYKEIRTPVFEHTELFLRSVGETTDVVQKEMYTFTDRGERSLTLKPEGTAGVARAFLEHGLFNEPLPQRLSYFTPCYRYDKPQAGRYREHHQLGVECFGASSPAADAEIIALAHHVITFLGLKDIRLEINSIGCPECREKYNQALKEYFTAHKENLCETCHSRLDKNPMRILDCKSPICTEIADKSPSILDYICEDCDEHFKGLKRYLDVMEISFNVNPRVVRGLDYYTRTVFEFMTADKSGMITVCGGGRYDRLVEEIGGSPMPACGFGMGIERLILQMENQGTLFPEPERCELYIASTDDESALFAAGLAAQVRDAGIPCQSDICNRSLKAQMKYANKLGAIYTAVIGGNEIETGKVGVKNMDTGESAELDFEDFADKFIRLVLDEAVDAFNFSDMLTDEGDVNPSGFTLLQGGRSDDEEK